MADTRLLQKILLHTSTFDHSVRIEEDLQIFPKATGVVIVDCFSVPKRCVWQNRDVLSTWHRLPFAFQPLILSMCMFQKAAVVPSSIGLDSRICCSICCSDSSPLTAAKYWRISLVLSVFPAPDSPLRIKRTKKTQGPYHNNKINTGTIQQIQTSVPVFPETGGVPCITLCRLS